MNFLGVHVYPNLLEQSWRELERERRRERRITELRAAHRAARPSRVATLTARLRHTLQKDTCPSLAEAC